MRNNNITPKVLIIGHTFDQTGIGITLKNLFSKFPKDNLACASSQNQGIKHFTTYFQFGTKEVSPFFPLNLFIKKKSQIINVEIDLQDHLQTYNNIYRSIYKKYFYTLFKKIGLYHFRQNYKLSEELKLWIEEFNPDIIFSALGDIKITEFLIEIKKEFPNTKLAMYILDDWVGTQPSKALFPKYIKKKYDKLFGEISGLAELHLAISEKMAVEYKLLYQKEFYIFHNPVDVSKFYFKNTKKELPYKVTYIGKVNQDNFDVINDISYAINILNQNRDIKINFNIYTITDQIIINKYLKPSEYTHIYPSRTHEEIPELLSASHILILPLSFTQESVEYTRLSISTKLTEYMASGVPIIIYAHPDTALSEYAEKHELAVRVTSQDIDKLKDTIWRLLFDQDFVNKLRNNCLRTVEANHEINNISQEFLNVLNKSLSK